MLYQILILVYFQQYFIKMIIFIIWLIGYTILFIIFIATLIKTEEDISLGDLLRALFFSVGSWVLILVGLIEYSSDITIYKRKKK